MKIKIAFFILIIPGLLLITLSSCKVNSRGLKPEVFELERISTKLVEYSSTFSNSNDEVYFARSNDKWGSGNSRSSIYRSVKENQEWSEPKLASFSGTYDDSGPHIANNGKTLWFISERPSGGIQEVSPDIWRVEKDKTGAWGAPIRLSNLINSNKNEYSPRTDEDGNLYFASDRPGGYGQGDLYVAKKEKGEYTSPINLGNSINSKTGEWNLEISKDGSVLIFEASGREQNLSPYGDLYISFKLNNEWTAPQNIEEINTTGSDLYPDLIEDDLKLYFTSSDSLPSTNTNIYSIDFRRIQKKYRKNSKQAMPPKMTP